MEWILNYPNSNYLYQNTWTSVHVAMFLAAVGKIRWGHWSSATGESKAAVMTTILNATMPLSSSMGSRSQFTMSKLAERSCKHCITAWPIKRRGKWDHSWVQSLACDWQIVAFPLFYLPCPRFRPPGDYFRTTKTGLYVRGPFSWKGSHKKMLMEYDIILTRP